MSTPIWDTGEVLASLIASTCHRCHTRARCIQLWRDEMAINLCIRCFSELSYAVGRAEAEHFMTEAERAFLNRTWCATCQSHFCSCGR